MGNHLSIWVWAEITYPFPTFNAAPWKFANGWVFFLILYHGCNYLSMLGLKVIHIIRTIGSGNGLVPSGNKPLSEPMLTQMYVAIRIRGHQARMSERIALYPNHIFRYVYIYNLTWQCNFAYFGIEITLKNAFQKERNIVSFHSDYHWGISCVNNISLTSRQEALLATDAK